MTITLSEIERRILGCLLEKEMTQADHYPMTLNAVVAACNQKSNRDPVLELDESAVYTTLEQMRKRDLVSLVLPAPGARSQRYKHEAGKVWTWSPRQKAIMTELLLRGPQTPGELRSRCGRMTPFESLDAVMTALESLIEDDVPVVMQMPREPGRSAVRYRHLLTPEDELPAEDAAPPAPVTAATSPSQVGGGSTTSMPENEGGPAARMAQLEQRLETLMDRVEDLSQRLQALENQWNG